MDVSLSAWLGVFGIILAMLAIDLFAHRKAHVIRVREAAAWSVVWVLIGIGFGLVVWITAGAEFGQQYFAGYLIEKSLAVDNVFVWAIIFAAFAVPREYRHRVLFLGVVGALVLRGGFIAAGAVLIENFSWILYVFAAFLIYTGYRMIKTRAEQAHPEKSPVLRLFRRFIPMTNAFHGQRFLVRKNGILLATPLLAVLVLVEVTDVVFAVDSIPAIFAVTNEPFIVFTANAFAILGLRAMYFLLADLMHRFVYLKIGLALVLVWVGVKMLLLDVFYIPTTVSLAVIVAILLVSILLSLRATRGQGRRSVEAVPAGAFRLATPDELAELEPVWWIRPRRTESETRR
ncbi:TerC family protein [Cryobacterium sp. TMT1-21]|uniref:TerC family protein n=1 Tax=unclassified Cryobacterium TaxID=2649013 RepID=UPI00106C5998|nr:MULTISPECIES: TerC family protein [unclassified Cryobacterium]TFC82099.1 TerC family protein [Cryobacterium sp. TmT2-59]TFD18040.1 TerC family protein [Cryobacterium sp. TMT1-21]TFD25068.1 TerC family protein [Cryobacterium sp. TMT2-23]TFD40853.1 TerC family protein [Cryobacterium sp. TMT2-10]